MRKVATAFLALSLALANYAQKKPLEISDFAKWNRIDNVILDFSGKYVSYELKPGKGDGCLIVYNASNSSIDSIPRAYEAQFDILSEFIAYKIKPIENTIRRLKLEKKSKEDLPKDSLAVMHLGTGETVSFSNAISYKIPKVQGASISLLSEPLVPVNDSTDTKNKKKASQVKGDKKLNNLIVFKPFTNNSYTFERVEEFAISPKGYITAFSTKLSDSTKNFGLVVLNTQNGQIDTIIGNAKSIKRIAIDEKGKQIAFLASSDTAENKIFSLYYTPIGQKVAEKIVDTLTPAIPRGWMPSANGQIYFSEDGSKLYFGTARIPKKEAKDSVLDEELPKLDLWSWTDNIIQPRQLKNLEREQKRTFIALYRIKEKKVFQLADTIILNIITTGKNNNEIALGVNPRPYFRQQVWSNDNINDYYLVNLKTGEKRLVLTAKSRASLSPTGRYTVWYELSDSSYYCLNNSNQKVIPLTKGIPVPFYDEENDTPSQPDPYGIMGWTENDEAILIYDRYDIWRIDTSGKLPPINETQGFGRKNGTKFRYQHLDEDLIFIPIQQEIILHAFNEKSLQDGFWSMQIGKPNSLKKLIMGDFMLRSLQKAKNSDALTFTRQTVKEFPDIYLSNLSFNKISRISDANPQQEKFIWATAELVEWVSFGGDSLRGILYKPENFDSGKKYPMISYFYERNSQTLHRYHFPQPSRSTINISFYTSNGYLVFVPDIVYRTGYPGQCAYDAIVSGVQHLVNTRQYIDSKRLGIQGQSWGGYQVAYLVTQTNIFAAAMAGAPVSNMTSAYGGIRWGSGMSRMFQYEQTQSRIGGTLWEKPMHYIMNSPLFHATRVSTPLLIMHNDNDGAVPWYQGIELFMALYRLNKPVWLLNYNGMEHNIEEKYWANRIDLTTRMFQFFNHYLRNEPAPEWMTSGLPAIEKGKKLGY